MFFFNDTATTEIYTLSLHDALPISVVKTRPKGGTDVTMIGNEERYGESSATVVEVVLGVDTHLDVHVAVALDHLGRRSEEHTSELQSRQYLVCRLLLEKKKYFCKLKRGVVYVFF